MKFGNQKFLNGAVATTRGWVKPETGELLVSIRGLPNAIEWKRGPIAIEDAATVVEEKKEELPPIEEIQKMAYDIVNPTQRGIKMTGRERPVKKKATKKAAKTAPKKD